MEILDRDKLFRQIRVECTATARPSINKDLTDDVILTQIEIAMEDYMAYINNWLTLQQWSSLSNLDISQADLVNAFTTKSLDFEKEFAAAFGKQTGVGTIGDWELKKDYVTISSNTQTYLIPANREINQILWETPAQLSGNIIDPFTPNSWAAAPYGWNVGGTPASALLPSFSLMLSSQDRMQKKKILQSELTYKISPGPNGTKRLFLYPMPGSRDEMTGPGLASLKRFEGSQVWYWYYDTNTLGRNKCLEENNDIIILPTDVPFRLLKWEKLNGPTQNKVRRLAVSYCKKYIGMIIGFFSGKINAPNNDDLTIDYNMFIEQSKEEKDKIFEELKEELKELDYTNIIKKKAEMAESLNNILKQSPPQQPFYMF